MHHKSSFLYGILALKIQFNEFKTKNYVFNETENAYGDPCLTHCMF